MGRVFGTTSKQAVENSPVDVVQCGMWKRDGRDGLVDDDTEDGNEI